MKKITLNHETMQDFLNDFDTLRHKFLYAMREEDEVDPEIWKRLITNFYPQKSSNWDMDQAVEAFRTMDKVYHYGNDQDAEYTIVLEQVNDKFLQQYVNIEGMEELFQSSYFYFEWMMHLEYEEQKHDYSYYRDHYLHQVRNLYEMFILLDQGELWRSCMEIYKKKNSRVAVEMHNSVREQEERLSLPKGKCMNALKEKFGEQWFEECCYHYIIFATAVVSSLVHDIGYPIVYMKRNMKRMQSFLPMSYIFMDVGNSMPHIKSLLSGSLLFKTVNEAEIRERLEKNDHGAYSAIILLCHYYDNGRIAGLDPVKSIVVELSALVIYNHTLKYAFQDKKKYNRYHSVFTDNPISYLFRLCDDLQEWERVYFLICEKSAFFVCDKCKTPMIRSKNINHVSESGQSNKCFSYSCLCGAKGWNSLWFPYRRMINVSPFTELEITGGEKNWSFELKCDRKALLQLAHYNDTFALQRLRGIRELRELVKEQKMLPEICIKAFLSNNPIAIKAKILEEFLETENLKESIAGIPYNKKHFSYNKRKFSKNLEEGLRKLKERAGKYKCEILNKMKDELSINCNEVLLKDKISNKDKQPGQTDNKEAIFGTEDTEKLMKKSLDFYLFLVRLGDIACKKELDFVVKNKEEYEKELSIYCSQLAKGVARVWNIHNTDTIDLLADCFWLMHCDSSSEKALHAGKDQVMYPARQDICDLVQSYMEPHGYLDMCERKRKGEQIEFEVDFYSDYFLFFAMDVCTEKRKERTAEVGILDFETIF